MRCRYATTVIVLLLCITFPSQSIACACCNEVDTFSRVTATPDDYYLKSISFLKYVGTLTEYSPPAADNPPVLVPQALHISGSMEGAKLVFHVRGNEQDASAAGVVSLPFKAATYTETDLGPSDNGSTPALYKEVYISGTATLTGDLASKLGSSVPAFFVAQGKGNACPNPAGFFRWILQLEVVKDDNRIRIKAVGIPEQ